MTFEGIVIGFVVIVLLAAIVILIYVWILFEFDLAKDVQIGVSEPVGYLLRTHNQR